jgi:hypothetical protein
MEAGLAAHHAPAHDAPRALDGNAPFAPLDKDDEGHHGRHAGNQQQHREGRERAPAVGLDLLHQIAHAAGQARHDARKDQQAHAVADAAVGDLLAQPHDEGGARGQRQDGHQQEANARIEHHAPLGEHEGDADRLQHTQDHGQIAGPLRDLAPPQFALFLNARQRLINHRQQLKDDRGGDVGHDAQCEDCHPAQVAAAEQVHQAQRRAAL